MEEGKTQSGKSQKRDILIPTEIIEGALTLEEIGALVVLMSLPHYEEDMGWEKNLQFMQIVNHFKNEGILKYIEENNNINAEIDLTWI